MPSDTAECVEVGPGCPVDQTIYGYYPNLGANAFFVAWFAALLILNLVFGIRYRTWTYLIALGVGCFDEVIGYVGRLLLHDNPWSETGFQMQICCLIIGPAFNSAAIYLTLKHVVITFGSEQSYLKPRLYTYIFITGDLIALVLQAIGGGMAATAGDDEDRQDLGTNIMIAGIVWQVITLAFFAIAVVLYVYRRKAALSTHPLSDHARTTLYDRKFRIFAAAVSTAYVAVLGRCIYRIAEMAGGWANHIMRDEPSFIVMEGAMIAYASFAQTVCHPGFCFPALSYRKSKATEAAPDTQEPKGTGHSSPDAAS